VISLGSTWRVLFIVLIIGVFAALLFGLILYDRITVNRRLDKMLPDVLADIKPRSTDSEPAVDNVRALVRALSSPRGSQGLTRTLLALGLLALVGIALVALLVGNGSNVSDPLKALITALAAALTTVLGFYFGARTANDATEAATAAAPRGPGTAVTVPDPPTGVIAEAGDRQATVKFKAPASTGGSPIAQYTVTSNPDSVKAEGVTSPIVVTRLQNGVDYTFTVHATNIVGDGKESDPSVKVTPATTPDAPTITSVTPGNQQVAIAFTAPASTGGSQITGYTATSTPGGKTASQDTSPIVMTGLQNGIQYTFTVHATNAVGDSPESSPSDPVTPQ
jgi:Fibronectin type III domain